MSILKITDILRLTIEAKCRKVQQMNSTTALQMTRNTAMTVEYEPTCITTESISRTLVEIELTETENFLRVLHVDDDDCFLRVSKQILETEGKIIVETANSVDKALEFVKEFRYDAIISDYDMPRKNGLNLLQELKKDAKNPPFIFFTGKEKKELANKAPDFGALGYVNKKGDTEAVYNQLISYIQHAARLCHDKQIQKTIQSINPRSVRITKISHQRSIRKKRISR